MFKAEDGIRDVAVTGVQTCALPIYLKSICLNGCLLCTAAETAANLTENYSAQVYLTVKMNNKTVRDVFSYIEKNSEFIFIYQGTKIDLDRKVSIDLNDQPVQTILHEIFAGTNDTYSIKGRQIIVKKSQTKENAEVLSTNQQKKTVTGLLTDADGNPVIGATVTIKGIPPLTIGEDCGERNDPGTPNITKRN